MKTLYVIPSYSCNLQCPHCVLRLKPSTNSIEKLLSAKIDSQMFDQRVLFGGEPLLLPIDKLIELHKMFSFTSISTNLLLLNAQKRDFISRSGLSVATSWNPNRYSPQQLQLWIQNIRQVVECKIHITVLITLTEDLVDSHTNTDAMHKVIRELDSIAPMNIKFEPYIQSSAALIEHSDEWLIQVDKEWRYRSRNDIAFEYAYGNIHDCSDVFTVDDTGDLVNSCPSMIEISGIIPKKCLSCKYSDVCKPCKKQCECSFFEKFYKYINAKK